MSEYTMWYIVIALHHLVQLLPYAIGAVLVWGAYRLGSYIGELKGKIK